MAVFIGFLSGTLVVAISKLSQLTQAFLFALPIEAHLDATLAVTWHRRLFVPILGGFVLSMMVFAFAGRLKSKLADAIEANALYGGRVSMRGSLFISIQTLLSNGFGGSVGLEAGYTQICAAIGSFFGTKLAARRSDMRLFVACGAAGAISAAFSAPLAGAFYAFEVILGAYTASSLVPVIASAVAAFLISRQLALQSFLVVPGFATYPSFELVAQTILVGIGCAAASILLMWSVALVEQSFQRLRFIKAFFRPIIGGAILGMLALLTPAVLGAGHGAMQIMLVTNPTWLLILTIIFLKILASAVSLGSGFRGGLFFASLLLGTLFGQLYSIIANIVAPSIALQPGTAAIAAMAALGTGVLGAPLSMICLALEVTGDFSVTVGAIVASSVAALIVRERSAIVSQHGDSTCVAKLFADLKT